MTNFESRWVCTRARQVQQLSVSGAALNPHPCTPDKPCLGDIWACGWRFILEIPADGPDRVLNVDTDTLTSGGTLTVTPLEEG